MNREQMIEKAAQVMCDAPNDSLPSFAQAATLRQIYRREAQMVVDAILPQVTTVDELAALPEGAVVIDGNGHAWRKVNALSRWCWGAWGYYTESSSAELVQFGPLTVVWQP